jgi:tetratricopeptide (TPR) repeat protein
MAEEVPKMEIELTLTQQSPTVVGVTCNGEHSHTFENSAVPEMSEAAILKDPVAYGKVLYQALFPQGTIARRTLEEMPERLLLVAETDALDAIIWEYLHGPDGFLVLERPFVRGLPREQRIEVPQLAQPLHIVAVPSNPLSQQVEPLNIDGEWQQLKDVVNDVQAALTLERTRPATIERLRSLVAGKRHRVVHFMGHGGQHASGAILCFEQGNGELDPVSARQFATRMRGAVFLVTLNACVSATPGPTHFSNLAKALVQQKTPYGLGMRVSISDEDARTFSRTLYDELARGVPIEEALLQARLTLSSSRYPWAVGVPVLYTALKRPASGFTYKEGVPAIDEHQPPMDVLALPRAQGTFQGRIEDLTQLGAYLTGDARARHVTIHGSGGQGKTALAREAVERFASAWPGGIWAISLENLPDRLTFALTLARFLGIETQSTMELSEIERHLFQRLSQKRTLLVLDNAETLVEAVEAEAHAAIELAQLLRQLPSNTVSLLVTSRRPLGWSQEKIHALDGLSDEDGAALFKQWAPARLHEIDSSLARQLSQKLKGHPLGLRLLAGVFNENPVPLSALIDEYERQLSQATDKYAHQDHRHRTLIACIETSVRHLNEDLRTLLGGLWIFRAPFLPDVAASIFDPDTPEGDQANGEQKPERSEGVSPTEGQLYALWQRGLLVRETTMIREGTVQFYSLLPTTRPYVEEHLKQLHEPQLLVSRFATVYAELVRSVYTELGKGAMASTLVRQSREDFEQAWASLAGLEQGRYLSRWGWIVYRQGNSVEGLQRLEQAGEIAQGEDQSLELQTLNNLGEVYRGIGEPQRARELYEQALPIRREVGDRAGEATTLNNLGEVYRGIGEPQRARELY